VILSTSFADYQETAGLRLPTRLTMKVDDFTTADYRFTTRAVDAAVDDLAVPAAVASAAPPPPPGKARRGRSPSLPRRANCSATSR
jgi:hypothetical protein